MHLHVIYEQYYSTPQHNCNCNNVGTRSHNSAIPQIQIPLCRLVRLLLHFEPASTEYVTRCWFERIHTHTHTNTHARAYLRYTRYCIVVGTHISF